MLSLVNIDKMFSFNLKNQIVIDFDNGLENDIGDVTTDNDMIVISYKNKNTSLQYIVAAKGNTLTVNVSHCQYDISTKSKSLDSDCTEYSLEFENSIDAICFDPTGICIIVSDNKGYLHFVSMMNNTCSLIFSHKVASNDG